MKLTKNKKYRLLCFSAAILLTIFLFNCGGSSDDQGIFARLPKCFNPTLNANDLCNPAKTKFTLASTNPYYPLTPGLEVVLKGEDGGEEITVIRTVLEETASVNGVTTHILLHKNYINGDIHEIAYNYYVESVNGTVCYFGEDVEFYENGELVDTQGTWAANNNNKPGIIMPAKPAVGHSYYQEGAPDVAADMGRISAIGSIKLGDFVFDNAIIIQDSNPMDDSNCKEEEKIYAHGVGEVRDVVLQVVRISQDGINNPYKF